MKTKKLLIYFLLMLTLVCAFSTGCKQQDTTLESILPRANVIKASVAYLNVGVGENIPQVSYEAVASECVQLCDLLYAAQPVVIEITESYSPELNASHEVYLTTSGGTMTIYYDDYQNLINVPINRKVNEQNVRVYLSYQTTGLAELLSAWQETLPAAAPVEPSVSTNTQTTPPDDAELRAQIDPALFDQAAVGINVTPVAYDHPDDNAVFYAYGYHEKSELPQNQVLIVAAPGAAETRQASILSVVRSDYYVLVNIGYAEPAEGAALTDAAVMVERADIDVDKPVIFLDENRTVLYAQYLDIPGETPVAIDTVTPEATEAPAEPSDAAGGEEGDDEPLQP